MSATFTKANPIESVVVSIREICSLYCKDLKALSPEIYTKTHGGKSRTMQDVTAEVAGFNNVVAQLISGTLSEWKSEEVPKEYVESLGTIEAGVKAIHESGEALVHAVENNQGRLQETVTTPWGETMSFFALANLCANHVWYHDGQLNFVQSLNGDEKFHWMDE